jgi:hypothetical protein
MTSRYKKFYETVKDEYLGTHPGLIDIKNIQDLFIDETDEYYTIPFERQFRPDLISQDFYNTTSLSWLITFVNGISDSPEGYYINRIIRIPAITKVRDLL